MGRRTFVVGAAASLATLLAACEALSSPDAGAEDASDLDATARADGARDAAASDAAEADTGSSSALQWGVVPALVFTVGVPLELDLRAYLTDPTGMATITVDMTLPPGLSLEDGVIRGTPMSATPREDYLMTADDLR